MPKGVYKRDTSMGTGKNPNSAFPKGHKINKDRKQSLETIEKRMANIRGEKSTGWKGDNVGYSGLHKWVYKILGKPDICEFCGTNGLSGMKIHWANKSGKYIRDSKDWIRLCVRCHKLHEKVWINRKRKSNGQFL